MKTIRRMLTTMLVVAVLLPHMATPASALSGPELGEFDYFPGVWQSNQYSTTTVAVQKFLMLYGNSLANMLKKYGTDGFCGSTTVEAIKIFQKREHLYAEPTGRVDTKTWRRIGELLEVEEIEEVVTYYTHFNRSYLDLNERVIMRSTAYYALNEQGNRVPVENPVPFYTP